MRPASGPMAYGEEGGVWSPDGSHIAFVSNQSAPDPDRVANPDVFVVEAKAGAAPTKLTTFAGTDEGPLVWTPDGKNIVYRQGTAPHYSIYDLTQMAMIPAGGGTPKMLAPKLDAWVGAPCLRMLERSGAKIMTVIPDDQQEYVAEMALDGSGTVTRITTGSGSAGRAE